MVANGTSGRIDCLLIRCIVRGKGSALIHIAIYYQLIERSRGSATRKLSTRRGTLISRFRHMVTLSVAHSSNALPARRGMVLPRLIPALSILAALTAVLAVAGLPAARAVPTTIFPNECYSNFDLLQWDVKRYGPVRVETGPLPAQSLSRPVTQSPSCSLAHADALPLVRQYTICRGGRVRFQWKGMHGVFQIPSIACPTNFTSGETESYKYLAPVGNGGGYDWEVPEPPDGESGHYWITSQAPLDCKRGMVAEFFVVDPDMKPFPSARAQGPRSWLAFAVITFVFSWFVPV